MNDETTRDNAALRYELRTTINEYNGIAVDLCAAVIRADRADAMVREQNDLIVEIKRALDAIAEDNDDIPAVARKLSAREQARTRERDRAREWIIETVNCGDWTRAEIDAALADEPEAP